MSSNSSKRLFSLSTTSFLRIPSRVRRQIYNSHSRQFHATPSLDIGLSGLTPEGFLTGLHAAGLTWAYVLPVAAITVKLGTFYVFQYPARRAAQRLAMLRPSIAAMNFNVLVDQGPTGEGLEKSRIWRDRLQKGWHAQPWRMWLPIMQLPVFLGMIEGIRRLLGMRQGLWAYATGLVSTIKDGVLSLAPFATGATNAAEEPAEAVLAPQADAAWTVEGPWWCPDLTALDPTYFLPAAIPIIMVLTATVGTKPAAFPSSPNLEQIANRDRRVKPGVWRRVLIVGSIAMGLVTPHMPAGLLWYWFWSTGSGLVISILTDRLMPIPKRQLATWPYTEGGRKRLTAARRARR